MIQQKPLATNDLPSPVVLDVNGASKHFAGAVALKNVSLNVRGGEVHAVLGQNGSGKSTLIKCLSGFHEPEPGWRLKVNGLEIERALHPGEFRQLGMSFVHQDLGLIPSLGVTENLRMGHIVSGELRHVRWREQRLATERLLEEFGVEVDARDTVDRLRPVDRALVAIVRAVDELRRWQRRVGKVGGVLLLDEATALLDREGKARVSGLISRIAAHGAGVVMVSHDLKEVLGVADRITVLRDGGVIATVTQHEFRQPDGMESLIERMTGQRRIVGITARTRRASPPGEQIGVEITGLRGGLVRSFSASLREGEVLGVTGLVGAGWEDVPLLVFGAKRANSGSLLLGSTRMTLSTMSPGNAVAAGLGLVPANRQEEGLVGELSIGANMSLPVIRRFMRHGLLRRKKEREHLRPLLARYGVTPPDPELRIDALSGGNQQKAVMAKWLSMGVRLLLLQDPTQGVDVAARERIHEFVWRAARQGTPILYATADYEELAAVADTVLVMSDGVVVDQFVDGEIDEEVLAASALRGRRTSSLSAVGGAE